MLGSVFVQSGRTSVCLQTLAAYRGAFLVLNSANIRVQAVSEEAFIIIFRPESLKLPQLYRVSSFYANALAAAAPPRLLPTFSEQQPLRQAELSGVWLYTVCGCA